jgi:hypothetical protein
VAGVQIRTLHRAPLPIFRNLVRNAKKGLRDVTAELFVVSPLTRCTFHFIETKMIDFVRTYTVSLLVVGVIITPSCERHRPSETILTNATKPEAMTNRPPSSGIELLGTRYSERLRLLYEKVAATYGRPIKVESTVGHVDNTAEILPSNILLRLRPGSSEDNVAHELVHPLLAHEGFPQVFSISILPLSEALGNIIRADLDHLVINQRLRELGYDPQAGFLRTADSYLGVVKIKVPSDQNGVAVYQISMLHELLKYCYYIGDNTAEKAILQKCPQVSGYWNELKGVIGGLPSQPMPKDIWRVAEAMNTVFDRICASNQASFRFSDLVGYDPVPLSQGELQLPASQIFEETRESLPKTGLLLRTFLRRGRMLAGVHIIPVGVLVNDDTGLVTSEFAAKREVKILTAK